jgi:allophanate hydrolase subunit 2
LIRQTGAVLFDIDDTTSLRTVNAVTGNYEIPVDGDPVNLMLDVSDTGGATVAAATAARPELVTNGTFDTNSNWSSTATLTISGGTATLAGADGPDPYACWC